MIFHPGPPRIEPGTHPGGVVVHIYEVPSGKYLWESHASTGAQAAFNAGRDAAAAVALGSGLPRHGVCLVAYDGDTGDRYKAEDWLP